MEKCNDESGLKSMDKSVRFFHDQANSLNLFIFFKNKKHFVFRWSRFHVTVKKHLVKLCDGLYFQGESLDLFSVVQIPVYYKFFLVLSLVYSVILPSPC